MDILRNPPGWGSLLGQGINEGISALANDQLAKMNKDVAAEQRKKSLLGLGFSAEESEALKNASDTLLAPLIKQRAQQPASDYFQSQLAAETGGPQQSGINAISNIGQGSVGAGQQMGVSPVEQGQPQGQRPIPRLNDRQAEALANVRLKRETNLSKKDREDRKYYTDLNQKKIDAVETEYDPALKLINMAKRSKDLLKSGKFSVGPVEGRITQGLLNLIQNPEATEYIGELNDFITQTYGDTQGVKSKAFLEALKEAKAKFTDPMKAQEYFWDKQIKERLPKIYKKYALEDIKEGGGINKDFESKFNKLTNLYANMPKDLPNPQGESPDTQYEDEKTGVIWGIKNDRWYPVGKGL